MVLDGQKSTKKIIEEMYKEEDPENIIEYVGSVESNHIFKKKLDLYKM